MSKLISSVIVNSGVEKAINGQAIVKIEDRIVKDNYQHIKGKKYARLVMKKDGSVGWLYCGEEQAVENRIRFEFEDKLDNTLSAGLTDINKEKDNMDKTYDPYNDGMEEHESEDLLRPLPNWAEMELPEIMARVSYHKRVSRNGVSSLIPMKDEKGNLIPIKRDWDCSAQGWNKWGNESPEDSALNVAAKAEAYLNDWGFNSQLLEKAIQDCIGSMDQTNIHPFSDAEDVVEYLLAKRQEKYAVPVKNGKVWLIKVLGMEKAKEVWKAMKTMIEKEYIDCLLPESGFDFEKATKVSSELSKTNIQVLIDGRLVWEKVDSPMRLVVDALGKNVRLEKSAWVKVAKAINAQFWGLLTGALVENEFSPAVKGTLERYVAARLRIEMFSVLSEAGHVDNIAAGDKTPISEHFKPEERDWLEWARE